MKKNKTVQVMAILALLWIIISIVWTGILVLTTPEQTETYQINDNNISQEELQKIIDNNTDIKVWTWEIK
jgi:hypothetical protein